MSMAPVLPAKTLKPHQPPGARTEGLEETRFLPFINRCLILPRCLGTYSLKHEKNFHGPCPYLLAYNIVLLFITLQTGLVLRVLFPVHSFHSPWVYVCLNYFTLFLSFFLFSYRTVKDNKLLTNVIQVLEKTEKRLSELGLFFSYSRPQTQLCFFMVIIWAMQLIIFGTSCAVMYTFLLNMHYLKLVYILNPLCFVALLHAIDVQLLNATRHLFSIVNSHMILKKKIEFLENLVEIYEELCTVSSEISKLFSQQLLYTVCSAFTIFFFSAYRCVTVKIEFWILVAHCLEAFNGFLIVCMMCTSTENVRKQAKKFNTLLYQLMIDDKTNEISENKKLRLHISMKREVVFSACGFFNLDYTLIHSMVAAATTYLVILIQFGQPLNSDVVPTPDQANTTLSSSVEVSNHFTTPSWVYTTL